MGRPNRVVVAGVLLAAACASTHPSERPSERPDTGEYRIGREDVLEVVVWHEPELSRVGLAAGDRLLLCSDGLTAVLTDEQIGAVLAQDLESSVAETACEALVHMANIAGGPDNITVIVVTL